MCSSLLLLDEEEQFTETLAKRLEDEGFVIHVAASLENALNLLNLHKSEIAILGGANDKALLEILREIKCSDMGIEVILLPDQASIDCSIQAMKLGAYDCITKPVVIAELVAKITEIRKQKPNARARQSKRPSTPKKAPTL